MIAAHIIHEERGLIWRVNLYAVPGVGDEIRLPQKKYFKVTRIVWPLDEEDCSMTRVNIGVTEAV